MVISRTGRKKINCVIVPERKQLCGHRITLWPSAHHVDCTGAMHLAHSYAIGSKRVSKKRKSRVCFFSAVVA